MRRVSFASCPSRRLSQNPTIAALTEFHVGTL
jgi:hypothetical protein